MLDVRERLGPSKDEQVVKLLKIMRAGSTKTLWGLLKFQKRSGNFEGFKIRRGLAIKGIRSEPTLINSN